MRVSIADARAMSAILATIRSLESGGNYRAKASGSSASGAYQMLDTTWRYYAARVQGASAYRRAADAPANVQDNVARALLADILKRYGGDVAAIGPSWYVGRYDPARLNYVPKPEAGNRLTVAEYQQKWLATFSRLYGSTVAGPASNATGQIAYSGATREGARIPADAYGAGSGRLPSTMLAPIGLANHRLHYTAAPAFTQLRQAALRAGINLTLTDSYRSYQQQAEGHKRKPGIVAPPGTSMHGYGLAVDLAEGWPPKPLTASTIRWLKENAHLYGWHNSVPRESWHYVYRGGEAAQPFSRALEQLIPSRTMPLLPEQQWRAPVGMDAHQPTMPTVEADTDTADMPVDDGRDREPLHLARLPLLRRLRVQEGWVAKRLSRIDQSVRGTMDGNPLTREAV